MEKERIDVEIDPLMKEALRLIIEKGIASVALISRRFSIGYIRASHIVEQMEKFGYVSPFDPKRGRTVNITSETYKSLYNEDIDTDSEAK